MDIAFFAALLALIGIAAMSMIVWLSPTNCRVVQAWLAARAAGLDAYREAREQALAHERVRLGLAASSEHTIAQETALNG